MQGAEFQTRSAVGEGEPPAVNVRGMQGAEFQTRSAVGEGGSRCRSK